MIITEEEIKLLNYLLDVLTWAIELQSQTTLDKLLSKKEFLREFMFILTRLPRVGTVDRGITASSKMDTSLLV